MLGPQTRALFHAGPRFRGYRRARQGVCSETMCKNPETPRSRVSHTRRSALATGMTIIEVLIVLGILGVLLGIAAPNLRTPPERIAANSIVSFIQQAKFEAIKQNRPIFLRRTADGSGLESALAASAADLACGFTTTNLVRTIVVDEYQGVNVNTDGLPFLWLPTGQPRACGGSPLPLGGAVINVTGGRLDLRVVIGQQGGVTRQ